MNETKKKRLEKRILRLIAELSYRGLKDPHIGFVTFTRCELSSDNSVARVYVSVFEEEPEKTKSMQALKRAAGFIRKRVGDAIRMKMVPSIHFVLDTSLEDAQRIDQLIDEGKPPEEVGDAEDAPEGEDAPKSEEE